MVKIMRTLLWRTPSAQQMLRAGPSHVFAPLVLTAAPWVSIVLSTLDLQF